MLPPNPDEPGSIYSLEASLPIFLPNVQELAGLGPFSLTGKSQKAPSLAVGVNGKAGDFGAAALKGFSLRKLPEGETSRKPRREAPGSFTRVGRFIRNYSLDHLPSLLNVLKGDIGIIGPRPMEPEFVDMQDPRWQRYFQVRSGLLNYAVLKLGKTFGPSRANNLALKQELELEYIEKRSLAFDCQLLLEVIWAHIASKGNIKMRGLPSPEVASGQSLHSGLHDDAVHGS